MNDMSSYRYNLPYYDRGTASKYLMFDFLMSPNSCLTYWLNPYYASPRFFGLEKASIAYWSWNYTNYGFGKDMTNSILSPYF
jgi:hypothetical protein